MSDVRLVIGERTITIDWNDSATTHDLLSQAPLDLAFSDYGSQEKLATLPRELTRDGAPTSSAAGPGDVSYYAPNRVFVLHYQQIGSFPGIVPLGRISAEDVAFVRGQAGDFSGRLTRG